jgi:MFS family permease
MLTMPDWPAWAVRSFFGLLSLVSTVAIAQGLASKGEDATKESQSKPSGEKLAAFRKFQRSYLTVYYIIMLADWLQGTNMYTLYSSYGVDISALFITGFASASVFGTIVGLYVDKWGRRFGCIIYLLLEVVINVFEHYNNFPLLMVSRLMGGVSTSLLFTAFESWMVSHHRKLGFPEEWLADTFSWGSFGNGLIAIVAGILAQVIADALGEIGPFQAAIFFTVLALVFVWFWEENYGGEEEKKEDGKKGEKKEETPAWTLILADKKMMLFGLTNALFEGSMFSFVFMWVPTMFGVLGASSFPTGLVFASLMACISLGGLIFSSMLKVTSVQVGMVWIFAVGAVALSVPVLRNDLPSVLGAFFVFETCVGAFQPAAGFVRSKVVPDAAQGTVGNIFRMPLNILVVVGTKLTDWYPTSTCFSIIVCWLILGAGLQMLLAAELGKAEKVADSKKAN